MTPSFLLAGLTSLAPLCSVAVLLTAAACLGGCAENPAASLPMAEVAEEPHENTLPAAANSAESWRVDANSLIGFTGSKAVGRPHDGRFQRFTGQLTIEDGRLVAGENRVTIDVSSLETDEPRLSAHLQSEDFFDVSRFPECVFVITRMRDLRSDEARAEMPDEQQMRPSHRIEGNLSLHGITQGISVPATVTVGEDEILVQARFGIDRQDWGLSYSGGAGDEVINDAVVIRLDLVITRE